MLTMTLCTILVCLWAIALERVLRRREKAIGILMDAINDTAHGKMRLTLENNQPTFKPNTGE